MILFVTGGAGFIGCNFIRYVLSNFPDIEIVNYDKLTYAGNLQNLQDIEDKYSNRYRFVKGDICSKETLADLFKELTLDAVVNFAAESHVDRSIINSDVFIETNIVGTKTLLDICLQFEVPLFIQISTDEVYGSLGETGKFTETSQLKPNSPYSASKAAADLLSLSYFSTFGLPVIITRCSNNYGPYQFPEKLIPLHISNALEDRELPVYGDGKNVRDWIFVDDHSSALMNIISKGVPGGIYNIGGDCEKMNISIAGEILKRLDKPESLIKFVEDRPGHDKRYATDCSKVKNEFGWTPETNFDEGLSLTIEWYINNAEWLRNVRSGEYLDYYEKNYKYRLQRSGK
ncbi:MAG: dTDP-glucose 4,6-dehydratase [bacterium]|nr:dTDP-glucose 4,6-dehydratase [bacterium]